MPTKAGGYHNFNGEKIPSVSTIISRFKESGALLYWAWSMGMQGKDYREEKTKAADAGTLAHAMVEAYIRNTDQPVREAYPEDMWDKGEMAYSNFKSWAEQTRLIADHPETSMISEKYQFGGTLDAVTLGNGRAILDWKSSNALYHDYLLQVAAYGLLWDESFPHDPVTSGYHIVRFSKSDADFEHRFFSDLEDAKKMFLLLREAYEYDKKLKKRLK